jgi:hypothetical protein
VQKDVPGVVGLSAEREGLAAPPIEDVHGERIVARPPEERDLDGVRFAVVELLVPLFDLDCG